MSSQSWAGPIACQGEGDGGVFLTFHGDIVALSFPDKKSFPPLYYKFVNITG